MSEEWIGQGVIESLMKWSLLVRVILRPHWNFQAEQMNGLNLSEMEGGRKKCYSSLAVMSVTVLPGVAECNRIYASGMLHGAE